MFCKYLPCSKLFNILIPPSLSAASMRTSLRNSYWLSGSHGLRCTTLGKWVCSQRSYVKWPNFCSNYYHIDKAKGASSLNSTRSFTCQPTPRNTVLTSAIPLAVVQYEKLRNILNGMQLSSFSMGFLGRTQSTGYRMARDDRPSFDFKHGTPQYKADPKGNRRGGRGNYFLIRQPKPHEALASPNTARVSGSHYQFYLS